MFKKKKLKEEEKVDYVETKESNEDTIEEYKPSNKMEKVKKREEARAAYHEARHDERRDNTLVAKNPLISYKFWVKIIAAMFLIILGIMLLVKDTEANAIVLMFTGGIFTIYSVFRIVFLIKSLEKGASRGLAILEIIMGLTSGILLIYLSVVSFGQEPTGFIKFATEHYNIIIGLVLWLRGFVYFVTTILFFEKTDKLQLFVHIAVITLGSFLLGVKINAESIALALGIISLISAVLVGGEGFFDYGKYRKQFVKKTTVKEKNKQKESGKEAPARDEKKDIPSDSPTSDAIIEPNKDDRPYIS